MLTNLLLLVKKGILIPERKRFVMTNYDENLKEIITNNKNVFDSTKEVGTGFLQMHQVAIKDGVLSAKEKELQALAIAVAIRCEGCIIQHTKTAIKLGATRDELSETIGVAIMMAGGPATVYGGKALACADQFLAEVEQN